MSNEKYTPGPWRADGCYVKDADGIIAMPVLAADARLMAAAPELLAACEMAERLVAQANAIAGGPGLLDRLRAAIGKAKGP